MPRFRVASAEEGLESARGIMFRVTWGILLGVHALKLSHNLFQDSGIESDLVQGPKGTELSLLLLRVCP